MKAITFTIIASLSILSTGLAQSTLPSPEELAEMQLKAYNARDLDAFLAPYSDSVKIYMYPDNLRSQGIESMRASYGKMFANLPDLHCDLVNRMVLGNTVIDYENVVFSKDKPMIKAIAIYKIENGKIAEVRFIYPD